MSKIELLPVEISNVIDITGGTKIYIGRFHVGTAYKDRRKYGDKNLYRFVSNLEYPVVEIPGTFLTLEEICNHLQSSLINFLKNILSE